MTEQERTFHLWRSLWCIGCDARFKRPDDENQFAPCPKCGKSEEIVIVLDVEEQ